MRKLVMAVLALGLMAILPSAARAQAGGAGVIIQYNICSDNTPVSANGVFNIDKDCPAGTTVVTGGYTCSCNQGQDELPVIVENNRLRFNGVGWETVGQTLASAIGHTFACVNKSSGEVKIVPSCTVGTNASPCHNNDICTDLSGGVQSPCSAPGSNPTCQVCISCIGYDS